MRRNKAFLPPVSRINWFRLPEQLLRFFTAEVDNTAENILALDENGEPVLIEKSTLGGGGTDDQTATEVPFTPIAGVTSTDVQGAVTDVQANVDAIPDYTVDVQANTLRLLADGTPVATVDLSLYLDDTNLARLVSGTLDGAGIATFTRDDATTFTVDFSPLFDDTNLARVTSGAVVGTNLVLTRDDASTVSIDISTIVPTVVYSEFAQPPTSGDPTSDAFVAANPNRFLIVFDTDSELYWYYNQSQGDWVEMFPDNSLQYQNTFITPTGGVFNSGLIFNNSEALTYEGTTDFTFVVDGGFGGLTTLRRRTFINNSNQVVNFGNGFTTQLLVPNGKLPRITGNGVVEITQFNNGQNVYTITGDLDDVNPPVQSVVAGNNTTVDNTDPLNPIVSSSGGTGLERITEGTSSGLRVVGEDPANYDDTGNSAITLGFSTVASTLNGASGNFSGVFGGQNGSARSFSSTTVGGQNLIADATFSILGGGQSNTVDGSFGGIIGGQSNTINNSQGFIGGGSTNSLNGNFAAIIGGINNQVNSAGGVILGGLDSIVDGTYGLVSGVGNLSRSFGEYVGGTYATDSIANDAIGVDLADRLLVFGNGTDEFSRSDAFIMLKSGLITLPSINNALIDAAAGNVLITKDWFNANSAISVNNGLTDNAGTVQLGGGLIQNTFIEVEPDEDIFTLSIGNASSFYMEFSNQSITWQNFNPLSTPTSPFFELSNSGIRLRSDNSVTPVAGQVWTAQDNLGTGAWANVPTSGGDLLAANNLSDVADAPTSLGNLGGASLTALNTFTGVNLFNNTIQASGSAVFLGASRFNDLFSLGTFTGLPSTLANGVGAMQYIGSSSYQFSQDGANPDRAGILDFSAITGLAGSTRTYSFPDEDGEVPIASENTFTPTLVDSSGNFTYTFTVNKAEYYKVGKLVYIDILLVSINTNTNGNPSGGQVVIGGLPFTPSDNAQLTALVKQAAVDSTFIARDASLNTVVGGISLFDYATSDSALVNINFGSNGNILIQGTYRTND